MDGWEDGKEKESDKCIIIALSLKPANTFFFFFFYPSSSSTSLLHGWHFLLKELRNKLVEINKYSCNVAANGHDCCIAYPIIL